MLFSLRITFMVGNPNSFNPPKQFQNLQIKFVKKKIKKRENFKSISLSLSLPPETKHIKREKKIKKKNKRTKKNLNLSLYRAPGGLMFFSIFVYGQTWIKANHSSLRSFLYFSQTGISGPSLVIIGKFGRWIFVGGFLK
jgi:hypothetical protein